MTSRSDPSFDRTPRFVVIELFDDAEETADAIAQWLVESHGDVKVAQPSFMGHFGRLIPTGRRAEA